MDLKKECLNCGGMGFEHYLFEGHCYECGEILLEVMKDLEVDGPYYEEGDFLWSVKNISTW